MRAVGWILAADDNMKRARWLFGLHEQRVDENTTRALLDTLLYAHMRIASARHVRFDETRRCGYWLCWKVNNSGN